MARYLAFGYAQFYPRGAKEDFVGEFDDFDAALSAAKAASNRDGEPSEYADIYDSETKTWRLFEVVRFVPSVKWEEIVDG